MFVTPKMTTFSVNETFVNCLVAKVNGNIVENRWFIQTLCLLLCINTSLSCHFVRHYSFEIIFCNLQASYPTGTCKSIV